MATAVLLQRVWKARSLSLSWLFGHAGIITPTSELSAESNAGEMLSIKVDLKGHC